MLGDGNPNSGTQGSYFRYQFGVLKLLQEIDDRMALLVAALPGADYEMRTTTYKANTNGVGYSTNDIISRVDIINSATGVISSTLWFNETTGASIAAPPIADLDPFSSPSNIGIQNWLGSTAPTVGQKAMVASVPVVLASDQSALPVVVNSGTITTVTTVGAVTAITNALPAGSNIIGNVRVDQTTPGTTNGVVVNNGNVGGFTTIVSSTVTITTGTSYVTGDYIGTSTTPQSFASVVRVSGGTGIIKSLFISDKNPPATVNVAMELWIMSATFVAPADTAAWVISDAEALTVQAIIPISASSWYPNTNNQVYMDATLSIPIKPAVTSLFYALVARGTEPNHATGDFTINLGILQD